MDRCPGTDVDPSPGTDVDPSPSTDVDPSPGTDVDPSPGTDVVCTGAPARMWTRSGIIKLPSMVWTRFYI